MLKVHVGLLEKQPQELEGEAPPEFFELEPDADFEIASPLRYRFIARLVSGSVLVRGRLEYRIRGVCGRCLDEVSLDLVNSDIALYFDRPETEEIDISPEIREEALLLLPVNLLCTENCRGLCPRCGANLNRKPCHCAETEDDSAPPDEKANPWAALDNLNL